MSWDERHAMVFDVTVMATPAVPVTAADTCCTYFDNYAPVWCNWNRYVLDLNRAMELVIHAAHSSICTCTFRECRLDRRESRQLKVAQRDILSVPQHPRLPNSSSLPERSGECILLFMHRCS